MSYEPPLISLPKGEAGMLFCNWHTGPRQIQNNSKVITVSTVCFKLNFNTRHNIAPED